MQAEFWLRRWREGRIGFHLGRPLPLLLKHWPALALSTDNRVLVPLCGKSQDLVWLAEQGYHVLGVELSPLAVQQFFDEHQLTPVQHRSAQGVHHVAGNIEIIQGDVFDLADSTLAACRGVYDRAALVALPPYLRKRYVSDIYHRLPIGCRGLLVALEYPQHEMDGPPFSVDVETFGALFGRDWNASMVDRRNILATEPKFRGAGLTAMHTSVYQVERKPAAQH